MTVIGAAVPVVAYHGLCTSTLHSSKLSGVTNGLNTLSRNLPTSCYNQDIGSFVLGVLPSMVGAVMKKKSQQIKFEAKI